jgi:hypothetical protein
MAGVHGDPADRHGINRLAALRRDVLSNIDLFIQASHKLVALKMARFLGFLTALAATGAFAMTPEYVHIAKSLSRHVLIQLQADA